MRFLLISIEFNAGEVCWPSPLAADFNTPVPHGLTSRCSPGDALPPAGTFSGNGVYACSQVRQPPRSPVFYAPHVHAWPRALPCTRHACWRSSHICASTFMQARALTQLGHEVLVVAGAPPGQAKKAARAGRGEGAADEAGTAGQQAALAQRIFHVSLRAERGQGLWAGGWERCRSSPAGCASSVLAHTDQVPARQHSTQLGSLKVKR